MTEDIHEILARDVCGEPLSPEEERALARWRQSSSEHESIYREFAGMKTAVRLLRERGGNHAGEAARRVARAIRARAIRRVARHAAAVLLLAGASFATWRGLTTAPSSPTPLLISRENDRATLVLDDERVITLRQGTSGTIVADTFARVINAGDRLVYEAGADGPAREHTLIVPVGGEYRVQLSDGTLAFLNSGTELRYPESFAAGGRREVHLRGEAWFEVEADATRPFVVHAGGVETRALGTAFNVSAYERTGRLLVTLVAGSVEVASDRQRVLLAPGQQALHDKQAGGVETREVATELYTSWKDGYYTFDRAPLEEIMMTLSLWYGIEVHYRDEAARHLQFTGRLRRYEDATRFLEMIGETRNVLFDIRGNDVTIRLK
jgi:ferric-dicitrate binding protein FerR (iron transport regulator)